MGVRVRTYNGLGTQGDEAMAISIHPELEEKLRARADAAGVSIETYIERIARDQQTAEEELEALAVEGLNSGESIAAGERYWAAKRQRLIDGHQETGT
ncbi:MAG: hypothetical protein HY820_03005 [Acidobacteria bacterium]|nr:hypothetical protein [Acidobacteriota bacterium]